MAMNPNDCASRINSAFLNQCNEIQDDANQQFEKYQQDEDEQYQKYREEHPIKEREKKFNNSREDNSAENVGVKSSIPKSSQTANQETTEADDESYQRSEYNFQPKVLPDFWDIVAKELDDEFQKGTPSMKNVVITDPAGSLKFNIKEALGAGDVTNATEIATKVSQYWAKTIQPTGVPQAGKQIVSVVNTAATIIAPLTAALISMGLGAAQGDNYTKFTSTVITHVKTIVWTVTELDPTIPQTYTLTVTVS